MRKTLISSVSAKINVCFLSSTEEQRMDDVLTQLQTPLCYIYRHDGADWNNKQRLF